MWEDLVGTRLNISLPISKTTVISYFINVQAIRDLNGLPLPREGVSEYLQVRCKVDGVPLRASSALTSNYDVESKVAVRLSSLFASNLSAGSHDFMLQWKRTGSRMHKWTVANDVASPSYSIIAHAEYERVSFIHEMQDAHISTPETWKFMTKSLNFYVPRDSSVTVSYSAVVQPQLLSFIKDRSMEYLTLRPVVDSTPYVEGTQTFGSNAWNPITTTLEGFLRLNISGGHHNVAIQWRKMGAAFKGWSSSPSFLDGFASSRNIIVTVDKFESPSIQSHNREIIKSTPDGGWSAVSNSTLQLHLIKESAILIKYALPITQHGNPNLDANVWAPLVSLKSRVVIDGVAYTQLGGKNTAGSRVFDTNFGELAVILPAGMHTVQLQWQSSPDSSWMLLNDISGGFAHGESLLTFISSDDARPSIQAPSSLQGIKNDVVVINSVSISDIDQQLSQGMTVSLRLSVSNGTLWFPNQPLLAHEIEYLHTDHETVALFTDTIDNINAALMGMEYYPNYLFYGRDLLVITLNDHANVGFGPPLSANATVQLDIKFIDLPFTLFAPEYLSFSIDEKANISVSPIVLSDEDSFSSIFEAQLSVTCGYISLDDGFHNSVRYLQGTNRASSMTVAANFSIIQSVLQTVTYTPRPTCNSRVHPEIFHLKVTHVEIPSQAIDQYTTIEARRRRLPLSLRTIAYPRWTLSGVTVIKQRPDGGRHEDYDQQFGLSPYQMRQTPFTAFVPTAAANMSEIVFYGNGEVSYKLAVQYGNLSGELVGSSYLVIGESRDLVFKISHVVANTVESYCSIQGQWVPLVATDSTGLHWKCAVSAAIATKFVAKDRLWVKLSFVQSDGLPIETNYVAMFATSQVQLFSTANMTSFRSARTVIEIAVSDATLVESCIFGSRIYLSQALVSSSTLVSCVTPAFSLQEIGKTVQVRLGYAGEEYATRDSFNLVVEEDPVVIGAQITGDESDGGWLVAVNGNWSQPAVESARWIAAKAISQNIAGPFSFLDENNDLLFALPLTAFDVAECCSTNSCAIAVSFDEFTTNSVNMTCSDSISNFPMPKTNTSSLLLTVEKYSIKISGKFVQADLRNASCQFDDETSRPVILHARLVQCAIPTDQNVSTFRLLASDQSVLIQNGSIHFTALPRLLSVEPTTFAMQESTEITITFDASLASVALSQMYCLFDSGISVPAVQSGEHVAICISPPLRTGHHILQLVVDNYLLSTNNHSISFGLLVTDRATVTRIQPTNGLAAGGDAVTVFGFGLSSLLGSDLYCRFGLKFSVAKVLSDNELECISPPQDTREAVAFSLDAVEDVYYTKQITYAYLDTPMIFDLSPAVVSTLAQSASEIAIRGVNLLSSQDLLCYIGLTSSRALVLSDSIAVCHAPSNNESVAASVSVGYGDITSDPRLHSNHLTLKYSRPWIVNSVYPKVAFAGTKTQFLIRGDNFIADVINDDIEVYANMVPCEGCRVVSSVVVSCACQVPTLDTSINWTVQVRGMNSEYGGELSTAVLYPPVISSIHPSATFLDGGDVVYLYGSGFAAIQDKMAAYCNFTLGKVTTAMILNDSTVGCIAPGVSFPMNVTVTLLVDVGIKVEGFATFSYIRAPKLWGISSTTFSTAGGQQLVLRGSYLAVAVQYRCAFAAKDNSIVASSVAVIMNETTIACSTPISDNLQSVTLVGLSIAHSDRMVLPFVVQFRSISLVEAVAPIRGSTSGEESLTVFGAFTVDREYTCSFNGTSTTAVFINQSVIACQSAPAAGLGSVVLSIFENGLLVPSRYNTALVFTYDEESWTKSLPATSTNTSPQTVGINTATIDARGGTIVVLTFEEDLVVGQSFFCQFSSLNVSAYAIGPKELSCISPELSSENSVVFRAGTEEYNYLPGEFNLVVLPTNLSFVVSQKVFHVNDQSVLIESDHLSQINEVMCAFDSFVTSGRIISDKIMSCDSPRVSGNFSLSFMFDGQEYKPSNSVNVEVFGSPIVRSVEPLTIAQDSNITFTIEGVGFSAFIGHSVNCVVDSMLISAADILSDSEITCQWAVSDDIVGTLAFGLVVDGLTSETSFTVHVQSSVTVFSISPSVGIFGFPNNRAVIYGANFYDDDSLACFVGEWQVRGLRVDNQQVLCEFSNVSEVGRYVYGLVYQDTRIHGPGFYEVINFGTVEHFAPLYFSTLGGDDLVVFGANFSKVVTFQCEFGTIRTTGTVVDSTQVLCLTPPLIPGLNSVSILANDVILYQSSISVEAAVHVASVSPVNAFIQMPQILTFTGKNFLSSEPYKCIVGDAMGDVIVESTSVATCQVVGTSPGATQVFLVNVGGLQISNALPFRLLGAIAITSSSSAFVSSTGADYIAIYGQNFPMGLEVTCYFGDAGSPGVVVDTNQVSCSAPSTNHVGIPVDVTLSFGGLRVPLSSLQIIFVAPLRIMTISQPSVSSGGDVVWIVNGGVFNADLFQYFCEIDGLRVPGLVINASAVSCVSPITHSCSTSFKVFTETVEAVYSDVVEPFCDMKPRVSSVTPLSVQEGTLATFNVTGYALNKVEGLICELGSNMASGVVVASPTSVYCQLEIPSCDKWSDRFLRIRTLKKGYQTLYVDCTSRSDEIHFVTPSIIMSSTTSVINVRGHFNKASSYLCGLEGDNLVTSAFLIDETTLQCPLTSGHSSGLSTLYVKSVLSSVVLNAQVTIIRQPVILAVDVIQEIDRRHFLNVTFQDTITDSKWIGDINGEIVSTVVQMSQSPNAVFLLFPLPDVSILCQQDWIVVRTFAENGFIFSTEYNLSTTKYSEFCSYLSPGDPASTAVPIFTNQSFMATYTSKLTRRADETLDVATFLAHVDLAATTEFVNLVKVDDEVDRILAGSHNIESICNGPDSHNCVADIRFNGSSYQTLSDVVSSRHSSTPFLLEESTSWKLPIVDSVRPRVISSTNATWINVYGRNFNSQSVCLSDTNFNATLSTIFISDSVISCLVPAPMLYTPIKVLALRVRNSERSLVSPTFVSVWFDAAYNATFHLKSTARDDVSELSGETSSPLVLSKLGHVCLLDDGCSSSSPALISLETFQRSVSDYRSNQIFEFNSPSHAPSFSQNTTLRNVSSVQSLENQNRSSMSQIFLVEPGDFTIPCSACYVHVVGSSLQSSRNWCSRWANNVTLPCYANMGNSDEEMYCEVPTSVNPGEQKIEILVECTVPIFAQSVTVHTASSRGPIWSTSNDIESRIIPQVVSLYPSVGNIRGNSALEITGDNLSSVSAVAFTLVADDAVVYSVSVNSMSSTILTLNLPSVVSAGEYIVSLTMRSGEIIELPQTFTFSTLPVIHYAVPSVESAVFVDVFGHGFAQFHQVFCKVSFPNGTESVTSGRIYHDNYLRCTKLNETYFLATFSFSFNSIDYSDPVVFVDSVIDAKQKKDVGKMGIVEFMDPHRNQSQSLLISEANNVTFLDAATLTLGCGSSTLVPLKLLDPFKTKSVEFSCMLDGVVIGSPQYQSNKIAVCKLPPLWPGDYHLQLVSPSGSMDATEMHIICTPDPKVLSVQLLPKYDAVKTSFLLRGLYFSEFMNIRCLVDTEYGVVTTTSSSKVVCTLNYLLPNLARPFQFSLVINEQVKFTTSFCLTESILQTGLDITNSLNNSDVCSAYTIANDGNRQAFVVAEQKYQFLITSVVPRSGLSSGNSVVRVNALGVSPTMSLRCVFGGVDVFAYVVDDEMIVCRSPSHLPGNVSFSVTTVDGKMSWCCETFYYYPPLLLSSAEPSRINGNVPTIVYFRAHNLPTGISLFCHINKLLVSSAMTFNASHVVCQIPVVYTSVINVTLGSYDEPWSNAVVLGVERSVIQAEIKPEFGSLNGQTDVTIKLADGIVLTAPKCEFGLAKTVLASYNAATQEVVCTTPASDYVGKVDVYIVDGENSQYPRFYVNQYKYLYPAMLYRVNPVTYEVGDDMVLQLFGANFMDSSELVCSVDSVIIPAIWMSSSMISCEIPGSILVGSKSNVSVQISNNNGSDLSDVVVLQPASRYEVVSIYPTKGFTTGGNDVFITFKFDVSNETFVCLFDGTKAQAILVDGQTVVCEAPMHSSANDVEVVIVTHTSKIVDSFVYQYVAQPILLLDVDDVIVSRVASQVSFSSAEALSTTMSGRFRTIDGTLVDNGRCLSEGHRFVCSEIITEVDNGYLMLEISLDGVSFISNIASVQVFSATEVLWTDPLTVLSNGMGELHFAFQTAMDLPTIYCSFGPAGKIVRVPAQILTSSSIASCAVPPLSVVDINEFSLHQHKAVIFGPTIITVLQAAVLDHIEDNTAYLGLPKLLSLHFQEPIFPFPAPAIEFQGVVLPLTVLSPFHAVVSILPSVRHDTSLFLMYPSQSTQKTFFANISIEEMVDDLNLSDWPLLVQRPQNYTVLSKQCTLSASAFCQSSFGNVTTFKESACRVECELYAPFFGQEDLSLRICEDSDCVHPLIARRINILPVMTIIQSVPSFGSVLGGSVVTLLGNGFVQDSTLMCLFGNLETSAFVVSTMELQCRLPPSMNPGRVPIQLLRKGVLASESFAEFDYLPALEALSVVPSVISSVGGTRVTVTLQKYLNASLTYYCRFNDVYVHFVVSNLSSGSCEAPAFSVNEVRFAIAAGRNNDLMPPVPLQVLSPLQPIFLDPAVLVAGSPGQLHIYFDHIVPEEINLECFFDGEYLSMDIKGDMVACHHGALESGIHSVSLRANGVEVYEMKLESRLPYRILSIWPQSAFADQSTSVEIELNGPPYTETYASCCFGSFRVPASFLSLNRWQCFTPTTELGGLRPISSLKVGMAFGESFCEFSNLEIKLIPKLEMINSSAYSGFVFGGDAVILPLKYPTELDTIYCRFGTIVLTGQYLSNGEIHCITPAAPRGRVSIDVSVNGVDFQSSGSTFEFLLPDADSYKQSRTSNGIVDASTVPVIYYLSMDSFPASGQFNVFVNGVNFNPDSVCKLGSGSLVTTVYLSSQQVQCFMPVRPAGADTLAVLNQNTGLQSLSKDIEFVTSPDVNSVSGTVISPTFGPRNAQTIITVSVPGLNGATGYSCLIGEQWVPSFNVTNSTLSCIAPPNSFVGQVKVQVGNPDPVLLDGFGLFEYIDDPVSYDVQPKRATAGATLLIFGRGFAKFPSLSLIIGSTDSSCSIISDERLVCEVPTMDANDYQIFLLTNGQHLIQTGLEYTHFTAASLQYLWPLNAPALRGQTILSIHGSNFPDTIDVQCLVDTTMVSATVLSPTLVQCRVPPHAPGTVRVSLLADGVPLHPRNESLAFVYVPDVSVVQVTPAFGYTAGEFPILVLGSNFINTSSLGCQFADMKSRAVFLSTTSLVCLLPSTLGRPELANQKNITVEVTVNGFDYSESKLPFAYSEPCDQGFFCPGLTRQLCPNGTYCPANSRNFTLCPPGTFQPQQGQTGCVLCAVGYLCPDQGMARPLHCPNGLVCDSMGLSATAKLCPAGSYCLNTTKASSPSEFEGLKGWVKNNITGVVYFNESEFDYSYTSYPPPAVGESRPQAPPESSCDGLVCEGGSGEVLAEAPFPCPIGHYCRTGAGTQIPIPKNFSSPQRCFDGFFCPRGSYSPEGAGPCPNGYFCPTQLDAIICPAGTYCPGVGNTAPVECYPGTYNPYQGQANCTVCPAGYICPGWGLLLPEPCPQGFVCSSLGLSYPVVLCPGGYVCDEGTITLDPSDTTDLKPKICKEGQFCLGGVASRINVEWVQKQPWGSTHPQLCSEGTYCQAGAYLASGSGLCFQGHYCPPNTSFPIATPLGNFASGLGAVAPTLCYPGTYAPLEAQINCDTCPSGFTCTSYGTYIPSICGKGTYRSQVDSLTCVNCPVGTYSYETGAPDLSLCLPCPQGAVCPVVQLTTFESSGTCPTGYICGAGTYLTNQFKHFSPAGYSTSTGTKPSAQYDSPCSAGFYCSRGTPTNQNEAGKCTVGAYCPKATPVSPSREILCPYYTTSPTATSEVTSCTIYTTAVCRKELVLATNPLENIYYYSSFTYDMLDESETTVELDSSLSQSSPTGEVQVVDVIHPLNTTSSTPVWHNDTIEAFRACPLYGSAAGGDIVTIIGRNFKDTELNFCKFRACLSANNGQHLRRCKNQVRASTGEVLPVVGNVSVASYITKARFISSTRMECETPEYLFNGDEEFNPTFATNKYECKYLDAFGNEVGDGLGNYSYVRPCDTTPGVTCPDKPSTGYEFFSRLVFPCTVTEIFNGICGNTPLIDYMMNPCMSGEMTVEVTNDGEHYSGGDDLTGVFYVSTLRYYDGSTIYDDFKNFSVNATLGVYTMVKKEFAYTNPDILEMERAHCQIPLYMEEAARPREADIYMLKAQELALVSIDLSFIPDFMVYGQHYVISIFVRPSRCTSNFCNSAGVQLPPEEYIPCQQPIAMSPWFSTSSIPKNVVNNITVFALDDLLFQVQIQIPYGLFSAYAPLFYNTTSVIIKSPSRSNSIVGKSNYPTRPLTPHVSYTMQTVPMQYFFCAIVYQDDSSTVYQPLNLPPRYSAFAKGRALIMNNVSYGNPDVPLVLDSYDDINFGVDFWMMPATTPAESKEQLDAYFETFQETTYDSSTGYTFDFQRLVISYFPYFSNCYGFDSYIPIWYLTENDQCALPDDYDASWTRYNYPALPSQDQIRFVGPFDFFTDPIADWCELTLNCNYEEQLDTTEATPRWFELGSSSTLFNLIRYPIDYFQYTGRENITVSKNDQGGGAYVQTLAAITTDNFIPVTITRTTASTGCSLQCFPRTFTLTIQYYQVDAHFKRIIAATLGEKDFDRDTTNTAYELSLSYYALGFLDLILAFAFTTPIFVVIFIFVGFATLTITLIGWSISRATTLLQNPPTLRVMGMLALIVPPPMAGVSMAVALIWFMTALANYFVNGSFVSDPNSPTVSAAGSQYIDQYPLLYNNLLTGTLTDEDILTARLGRMGLCFFCIALCCFAAASKMYFPREETKRELEEAKKRTPLASKEELWQPVLWKKLNFIFASIVLGTMLMCAIQLSQWSDFGTYFYQIIVMYLLVGELMMYFAERQLQDAILTAPLACAYGFTGGLIAFGSPNFLAFILSNYVDFAIATFQRLFQKFYLDGLGAIFEMVTERAYAIVLSIIPKYMRGWEMFRQAEEDEKDFRKRAVEGVALQDEENESVEPILDYFGGVSCDTVILWYFPFVVYLLMQYRQAIYIPISYGIRQSDMVIYMVYQLFLIVFQPFVDLLNHSQNELFYGWKIYEYLVYSRYRFLQRETRWKGMENSLDECIEEGLRRLDQMCFSSQYFLMLTMQFNGIIFIMLSYQVWIQNKYSPFSDSAFFFIVGYIYALYLVLDWFVIWAAVKLKVWRIKHENTAWHIVQDDDDELDIPAWEEIKGASTEAFLLNQRITSETFRYKFLNYNRTWLINQLPQLLTPRTLRRSRPYLINQFQRIINAKRDDISDDSEAEAEKKFGPVALTTPSRNIVRWWLGRARRRMRLRNIVEPLIKRARGAQCEQCLSRKQLQVEYEVDLDTMASMYDKSYPGDEEVDQVQWKTFWINNQRYHTICLACITKRKELDARNALRQGGYDPSLFEDDDQEAYPDWGPVFLSAPSKAILLNWYRKAQKLRAGKRKNRVRKDRVVKDISDDEGDEPAFSWLKDGLKDITPASKAIAVKWMRTARARLQQKRGKGAGLREKDLVAPEDQQMGEGFRSGMKSKMLRK